MASSRISDPGAIPIQHGQPAHRAASPSTVVLRTNQQAARFPEHAPFPDDGPAADTKVGAVDCADALDHTDDGRPPVILRE